MTDGWATTLTGDLYFCTQSAVQDSYWATPNPALTDYYMGLMFALRIGWENTTGATLDLNGLGARTIYKYVGGVKTALETGDMVVHYVALLKYDGAHFILMNPCVTITVLR